MKTEQQNQLDRALTAIRAAESGPTDEDLAAAPVLDLWLPLANIHAAVVLWGQVAGHPRIGASTITTSRLIALDRQAGCHYRP